MKKPLIPFLVVALLLVLGGGSALAQSGGTFNLRTTTLDAGGGTSTGGAFTLSGTVGQHDANPVPASGDSFTVIGGFWQGALSALAVTLNSFEAQCRPTEGDILLLWETATETDVLGFNLLRATSATGETTQLNGELIPSESPGGGQGASYEYADTTVQPTPSYYYWLEAIDIQGNPQRFGPVESTFPCATTAVSLNTFTSTDPLSWGRILLPLGIVALGILLVRHALCSQNRIL